MGVVQLLLDHVESRDVNDVLWLMFSVAAEAGRDKFMRFAVGLKLHDTSVPSAALRWAAEHALPTRIPSVDVYYTCHLV